MGKKYKIIFDRDVTCIGVFACVAAAPNFWEIGQDGKANLLGEAKKNEQTGFYELIIDEKDFQINLDAARVCPVLAITIIDMETGKKIFPEE